MDGLLQYKRQRQRQQEQQQQPGAPRRRIFPLSSPPPPPLSFLELSRLVGCRKGKRERLKAPSPPPVPGSSAAARQPRCLEMEQLSAWTIGGGGGKREENDGPGGWQEGRCCCRHRLIATFSNRMKRQNPPYLLRLQSIQLGSL
ncbi:hypothetical protein JRQ81_016896 [Phrynocephalus forsythii]|uniref:Uncharacterized protein n=1 Tax=Phrynocephalus forsythii TaxID=171643 RepID=A0A9Q0XV34_9SAUR|nr:hypothetical protein JRQ81_016896 [Phrynocephalus forsythii]